MKDTSTKNNQKRNVILALLLALPLLVMVFIKWSDAPASFPTKENKEEPSIIKEDDSENKGKDATEYIIPSKYNNIKIKTTEEQADDRRYTFHASWPVTENEVINADIDQLDAEFLADYQKTVAELTTAYADYQAETGEETFAFHADYNLHFDVAFASDNYLAFVFYKYINTGNTGNEWVFSKIYQRGTGESIPIERLFSDGAYLKQLSALARENLYQRIAEEAKTTTFDSAADQASWQATLREMVDQGTEPKADNFHSLVITDENILEIYFDKYQVAPGYWGVVKVEIPLQKMADFLAPEVRELFGLTKEADKNSDTDETKNSPTEKTEEAEKEEISTGKNKLITNNQTVDCATAKCIALTFDDGPSVYTENLLTILQQKNARATFFVLGMNAKIQQQTILDLQKAGMEIGSHTWSHKDLTKLNVNEIEKELTDTADLLEKITGQRPTLLRPPYGATDARLKSLLKTPLIMWNIDTEDWKHRDSDYVLNHIKTHAKPGAIILMHDIHKTTVDAIPRTIDFLQSEDYQLVTISELFGEENLMVGGSYAGR